MADESYSPRIKVTPTIDTAAYTSGDVVGSIQTVGGGPTATVRPFGDPLTGVLKTVTVKDNANQKAAMTLLLFDQLPTGTYTNNGAFVWGAGDFAKCIGQVNVAASDYTTTGSKAIADVDVTHAVACRDATADRATNAIYVIAVTTGTPTYGAASDLEFQYGFLRD